MFDPETIRKIAPSMIGAGAALAVHVGMSGYIEKWGKNDKSFISLARKTSAAESIGAGMVGVMAHSYLENTYVDTMDPLAEGVRAYGITAAVLAGLSAVLMDPSKTSEALRGDSDTDDNWYHRQISIGGNVELVWDIGKGIA